MKRVRLKGFRKLKNSKRKIYFGSNCDIYTYLPTIIYHINIASSILPIYDNVDYYIKYIAHCTRASPKL